MLLDSRVFEAAMDEMALRSRKALYQRDYLAWASDILGRRYYTKMQEVATDIAHATNGRTRTATKSANGCGKSFLLTDVGTWWVTAFPPEESLAIYTANGRDQIQRVVWKYLKDNYGYMAKQAKEGDAAPPIGWISEQLEWNYQKDDGSGKEAIAFGKRPADQDIVSSFQGTRKRRTLVGLDEMGGLPEDIITAAEAVTTGEESRIAGIGNPDRRGTAFHRTFTDPRIAAEWNLHSLSAYDLPTMTGEVVYPDDPDKQAAMMAGLTSARWIAHKERVWKTGGEIYLDEERGLERNTTGKPVGRFKAKVLGDFPNEDDRAFFAEDDINEARENEIDAAGEPIILGVDLAAMGDDESVVMVNQGGRCRIFDREVSYDDGGEIRQTSGVWSKEDEVTSARRVHAIAQHLGATQIRVDAGGLGSGVAAMLLRLKEFEDKCYGTPIRVLGASSSTDINRWNRLRDENHDYLRGLMRAGKLDLDQEDTALKDQLLSVTYELDNRGAVKITPKKLMRSDMHGSPDRLDALIYATLDSSALMNRPLGHLETGDVVTMSPREMLHLSREDDGYPL
jgi:hypothetical protein